MRVRGRGRGKLARSSIRLSLPLLACFKSPLLPTKVGRGKGRRGLGRGRVTKHQMHLGKMWTFSLYPKWTFVGEKRLK